MITPANVVELRRLSSHNAPARPAMQTPPDAGSGRVSGTPVRVAGPRAYGGHMMNRYTTAKGAR